MVLLTNSNNYKVRIATLGKLGRNYRDVDPIGYLNHAPGSYGQPLRPSRRRLIFFGNII